jgi:hypothetical protein
LYKIVDVAFHVKDFKLKASPENTNVACGNDTVFMCPGFSGGMQVTVKFPNGMGLPFNCDLVSEFVQINQKIIDGY